jgi:TRAP-type C4-dicarboxylate transport system substrate-binding protein
VPCFASDIKSADHDSIQWWADEVEKRTNGEVKITLYWGETLVKLMELLDATRIGTVDMSWMITGYFPAQLPLNTVGHGAAKFHYTYAPAAAMGQWQLLEEFPELEEEFKSQNLKVILPLGIDSTNLISNKLIKSVGDMKGIKARAPGAIFPKVVAAAGATPVSLPAPEIYDALTKGIIDCATGDYSSVLNFKLYEAAKYNILVNFGAVPSQALVSNLDVWNSLSEEAQSVILDIRPEFFDMWATLSYAQIDETKQICIDKGMELIDFPDSEREKWRNLPGNKVLKDEWIADMEAKGLPGKAVMERWLALEMEMEQTYGRDGTHWK